MIEILHYASHDLFLLYSYDDPHDLSLTNLVTHHMLLQTLTGGPQDDFSALPAPHSQPPSVVIQNSEFRVAHNTNNFKAVAFLENDRPALCFSAPLTEFGIAWVRNQCRQRFNITQVLLPPSSDSEDEWDVDR
jgi:hypothetical protein